MFGLAVDLAAFGQAYIFVVVYLVAPLMLAYHLNGIVHTYQVHLDHDTLDMVVVVDDVVVLHDTSIVHPFVDLEAYHAFQVAHHFLYKNLVVPLVLHLQFQACYQVSMVDHYSHYYFVFHHRFRRHLATSLFVDDVAVVVADDVVVVVAAVDAAAVVVVVADVVAVAAVVVHSLLLHYRLCYRDNDLTIF